MDDSFFAAERVVTKKLAVLDDDGVNEVRTLLLPCVGLDPFLAATGVEAHLCRRDPLLELEAFALVKA